METKKAGAERTVALIGLSGRKTIVSKEYQALLSATYGTEDYNRLQGPPADQAAAGLGISRMELNRAIDEGSLDAWYVYDGYTPGVRRLKSVTVTTESIMRFRTRKSRRN